MVVLPARDRVDMPWKNGGGTTREIAIGPRGASFDDFGWRISLAEIRTDGPFSRFPGVDRILTVVAGRGMTLTLDTGETREAVPDSPIAFRGESDVVCRLHTGPDARHVTALNVMTRRRETADIGATVEILTLTAPHVLGHDGHDGRDVLVLALRASITVGDRTLAPWDGALMAPHAGNVELSGPGVAAVIRIETAITSSL